MNLPHGINRCLGHGPDGKPNGCDRAEQCARHLAIRTDRLPVPTVYRGCSAEGSDGYIDATAIKDDVQ